MNEPESNPHFKGTEFTRRSTLAGILGISGGSFFPHQTPLDGAEHTDQLIPLFQAPVQGGTITPESINTSDPEGLHFPNLLPPNFSVVIPFNNFQCEDNIETFVSISGAVSFNGDASTGKLRLYDLTNDTALEETTITLSRQNTQEWPQPFEHQAPYLTFSSSLQSYQSSTPAHLAYQGDVNADSMGLFHTSINVWGRPTE